MRLFNYVIDTTQISSGSTVPGPHEVIEAHLTGISGSGDQSDGFIFSSMALRDTTAAGSSNKAQGGYNIYRSAAFSFTDGETLMVTGSLSARTDNLGDPSSSSAQDDTKVDIIVVAQEFARRFSGSE